MVSRNVAPRAPQQPQQQSFNKCNSVTSDKRFIDGV
jgi:hypothetical protein